MLFPMYTVAAERLLEMKSLETHEKLKVGLTPFLEFWQP